MRKFSLFCLLMIFSLLIFSCLATGNTAPQQNTARHNNDFHKVNPEELFGKKLVGYSIAGMGVTGRVNTDFIFRLRVNDDGTFELKVDESDFLGTWAFDINAESYRYVFEWFVRGEKQGFKVDFFGDKNTVTWMGKRFDPDENASILIRFKYEE